MRFSVWDAPDDSGQSEVQDNKTGRTIARAARSDAAQLTATLNLEGLTQVFGEVSLTSTSASALQVTSGRFQWEADVVIYGPDWNPQTILRGSPV